MNESTVVTYQEHKTDLNQTQTEMLPRMQKENDIGNSIQDK